MSASQTVLITGAAGFLGRYIARQFAGEGWRVLALDDVPPENAPAGPAVHYTRMHLPSAELASLLTRERPTVCVHCAGRASVPFSMSDPAADFRDNTVLTFEVLEALRQAAPACRFLFLSSAAVYGNPETLPVSETHRCAPLSPYGYHKRVCELLCEEYSRIYSLKTAVVRIFSAYGAGLRRQVVWDICAKALTAPALQLRGTGRESRDFIHASDIARAVLLLGVGAECDGEVYNLATGCETTVAELADTLVELLGMNVRATFDGVQAAGDPLHWRADISRLKALGFAPRVTLPEGLRTFATWAAAELSTP